MKHPLDYAGDIYQTKKIQNLSEPLRRVAGGMLFFLSVIIPALVVAGAIFGFIYLLTLFTTSYWWIPTIVVVPLIILAAYKVGGLIDEE